MRNYLSVIALAARGTLFKVLGILLIMAAAELGIFYVKLNGYADLPLLENIIDTCFIRYIFTAGFILATVQLFFFLSRKSNVQTRYTLSRLPIKETRVSAVFAVYNLSIILIAWAVQLLLIVIMGQMYIQANTAEPYSPVLFLAFYRSPFLHGLLPLEDWFGNITNLIFFIALALSLSAEELRMRHGKIPASLFILLAVFAVTANRALGNNGSTSILFFASCAIGAFAIFTIVRGVTPKEEEEQPHENEKEVC